MDGIEIITKETVIESNITIFWIIMGIIVISLLIIGIYSIVTNNLKCGKPMIIIVLGSIPLMLLVGWLCCTVFAIQTDRYEYTAKIDESVSLVEFYDNYTNIEYRDGIWHFEDRK